MSKDTIRGGKKRKRYTDDFRASAVLMLEAAGYPDKEGAAILYGIYEKGNDQPFYIGSTKYDMENRFCAHIAAVRSGRHTNRHFTNKVMKLGIDNVEAALIHGISLDQQFFAERSLIEWVIGQGIRLTNKIYNGVFFDVDERVMEYAEHPGMTPDE